MICLIYRFLISNALDTDSPLSPALGRHVDRCSDCKSFHEDSLALAQTLADQAADIDRADFAPTPLPRILEFALQDSADINTGRFGPRYLARRRCRRNRRRRRHRIHGYPPGDGPQHGLSTDRPRDRRCQVSHQIRRRTIRRPIHPGRPLLRRSATTTRRNRRPDKPDPIRTEIPRRLHPRKPPPNQPPTTKLTPGVNQRNTSHPLSFLRIQESRHTPVFKGSPAPDDTITYRLTQRNTKYERRYTNQKLFIYSGLTSSLS